MTSLGSLSTSALGFGGMGLSGVYGAASDSDSRDLIRAAVSAGVSLLDTGDFYNFGHNEMLFGSALAGVPRSSYQLSVKFGALRSPDGGWGGFDGRPAAVKNFLGYSLQRLGVDHIDIYRPARLDPDVPIEETIGAIAELVTAGYVREIGLSEVGASTIQRAAAVHPISDLQIEYSVLSRGPEASILPVCASLGIGVTAYGVLSRGLISESASASSFSDPGDFRAHSPRFQGSNLSQNLELVSALRSIAASRGVSVAQLAVAWVAAQGASIVPLIGTRKLSRLQEAQEAVALKLTPAELSQIDAAVPPGAAAGERYAPAQMTMLDSER
jgi:aryl-alcohol dehydrogenase-like predicted oxidoreductase